MRATRNVDATLHAPAARVTTDVVDDRRAMRVAFDARAIAAWLVVDVVNMVVAVRARVCRVIDIDIGIGVHEAWGTSPTWVLTREMFVR